MRPRHLIFLAVLALVFTGNAFGQYQVLGSASTRLPGNLERTETTVQVGSHPLDQFKVTRLIKNVPPRALRAVVFLLPSLGIDFTSYEQTEPGISPAASIAGFFALRNFAVYGYSSRMEGIPAGTCEAGVLDCSIMQTWDLQSVVDDITFVRGLIADEHPDLQVFVGGLSLGGISTVAVINAHPDDYDGAFIWEGMLYSPDPQVQALNTAYCQGAEAQLAAGIYYDGVGSNVLKKVVKLADANPSGLTPIPLFPGFLTNRQVLVTVFSQVTPGPVTMPVPGYFLTAGDLAQNKLLFASPKRLTENVSRFNDYATTAVVRDVSCSLAGLETAYINNLGNYHGAVLGIGGGHGFGPYLQGNLDLIGSDDIELLIEPEFGHADHLLTARHRRFVEQPILEWIRQRLD